MKMEVVQWSDASKDLGQKVAGKKVYMVAATLRPETMYGQTCCFVGTGITYGLFEAKDGESLYLITERSARNMAFQDTLLERGKFSKVAEVKGSDLVGTRIKAPTSIHEEVYVLPMDGVSATKGTGVVTCVPSDSPDDYATTMDLRKKPEFYKIEAAWIDKEIIPVISTPNYGEKTAEALCKKMKINSQKDVKQLAEAKEIAYKEGFYQGTMVIGPYKGEPVEKAKGKVRKDLIEAGVAFDYQEPMSLVMSRSADECVVALVDQWYMDYGSAEWKPKAEA
jgi:leucyl-tRNA synthetase